MTTTHQFGAKPLSCHSWNADRSQLALSHNNNEVNLYAAKQGGWTNVSTLAQHDLRVTGIDWAPKTNRIVTCSADRNAYVWIQEPDGSWKHTLVLLRINRAATCVRWSPEENKFAVGSGARIISVCYFEKENDWWVAKHIKKPLRSTITALDWHPNNILLAAGAADFKVRVFSGYVKEIEPRPSATTWGAKMPMGNMMAEFSNSTSGGGWIHSVSFSVDGSKLAWVGHDSSISVVDAGNGMAVNKLRTALLPMLTVIWVSPNTILAAGHDCVPIVFNLDQTGQLSVGGKLEEDKKVDTGEQGNTRMAMQMFQNKDRVGRSDISDTVLDTTHQNQVYEMRIYAGDKSATSMVSTVAGDGKLVVWDLNTLASKLNSLKIK